MEISNEQLKVNMEKLLGKDVLLLKPHIWNGEQGKAVRVELSKEINKMGMVVLLDNGTECFVFNHQEIMFIIKTIKV